MKNIYVLSILAGILSIPLFFILLIPIAISQLGTSTSTGESFNTTTFAFLIALLAGVGCSIIEKITKRTKVIPSGVNIILLQVIFSVMLYVALIICSKLIISNLPEDALSNSSGGDTTTKQSIQWATVLFALLFQHLIFWRYIASKYPR